MNIEFSSLLGVVVSVQDLTWVFLLQSLYDYIIDDL